MEESGTYLSSFILGFHGCDAAIADAVFSGSVQHLLPSANSFDWLGSGIYFWEANAARALEYAHESMRRPSPAQGQIRTPAVIGAVIDLGYCLNLLDAQFFPMVREIHGVVRDACLEQGMTMPVNRRLGDGPDKVLRDLDCLVINTIHEHRRKTNLRAFDSVRAAFTEGNPLYEGAFFYDKNHIQICVRDTGCIKGYFRPIA